MTYIREDQAAISVSLNGVPYGDSWATTDGGGLEADSGKTRPGGMGKEVALGGPSSRQDMTVQTQFTDIVAAQWHPRFDAAVGTGRVKVSVAWLGPDKLPLGSTFTVVGVLSAATPPNVDPTSSDAGMYEIVVSLDEAAA